MMRYKKLKNFADSQANFINISGSFPIKRANREIVVFPVVNSKLLFWNPQKSKIYEKYRNALPRNAAKPEFLFLFRISFISFISSSVCWFGWVCGLCDLFSDDSSVLSYRFCRQYMNCRLTLYLLTVFATPFLINILLSLDGNGRFMLPYSWRICFTFCYLFFCST